jgi:hypothetical protein
MPLRYERISYCRDNIDGNYNQIIDAIDRNMPDIGKRSLDSDFKGNISGTTFHDLVDVEYILYARHCELPLNISDEQAHQMIRKGVQIILHYYFDNWHEREWSTRQTMRWTGIHPTGILCALLIGDKESIKKIAEYLDEDMIESGEYLFPVCEDEMIGSFLVLLSVLLAEKSYDAYSHLAEQIRQGKKKKAKLLLEVLDAIVAKDNDKFAKTLQEYIKYFIKREVDLSGGADESVSTLGSILWETARIQGISLPKLPEEIMDRVVTRETIGVQL